MNADDAADIYARAGFGQPVQPGTRPAVVVVDFTYGFTDPKYPTGSDMSDAVLATAGLLDAARTKNLPVIFTKIAYDPGQVQTLTWLKKATGMTALEQGSRLVEIDARLSPRAEEHVVVKTGASAFFGTSLASYLVAAHVDTVIIAGATTSGCVRASVVDAVQHGYPTLIPLDCVADRAQAPHDASLFDMNEKYGDVVGLDDVVGYLTSLPDDAPATATRSGHTEPEPQSITSSPAEAPA